MRESLGWMTNCANTNSCPQNWLDVSVTDVPTEVWCHVCNQSVSLVSSQDELDSQVGTSNVAALPVMPPIAHNNVPVGGFAEPTGPSVQQQQEVVSQPVSQPVPVQKHQWVCTLANGEMIRLDKETMTVGRSRTCDVVVPSAKVSRQHASLSLVDGELFIEDLGSANGVWLNGEKVSRTKINSGDVYTISDETLLFEAR